MLSVQRTIDWVRGLRTGCEVAMFQALTLSRLLKDRVEYAGTGGVSERNQCCGFMPAFLDCNTGQVYPSLRADGQVAGFHCLDGLPDELVQRRDARGCVCALKAGVQAGFVRDGRFYTREEAARQVATEG